MRKIFTHCDEFQQVPVPKKASNEAQRYYRKGATDPQIKKR